MKKSPGRAGVAAVLALAAAGCGAVHAAQPAVGRGTAGRATAASPRPAGRADTAFGLDMLRAWCRSQPRSNIVFSPSSLATGLGLAYLGARGATAAAIARVLHLPAAGGPLTEADMRARQSALGRLDGPGVTLARSDRIWSDPSLLPRRSYLDAVATADQAGLSRVPLDSDPVQAAQLINAAIARDTRGKIPRLLSPGSLAGPAWVLTDALYLNAAWARPFSPSRTEQGPFTAASGGTATARFMHGTGYRSASARGWTAVALPYRGGRLAMTALLPRAGPGALGCQVPAPAALRAVSADLYGPGSAGASRATAVALPKVSLGSHQEMDSLLTGLGMGVAFSGRADFTGLSPSACCISFVEHAATLQVGEKGTVGSAATAVGLLPADIQVPAGPEITFDRPYLMLVTDTVTGEPLFLARVADPGA
jgi:serine protease inhibitor